MDKHLKLIILLAVCIILCNQLVHLYQLYKVEKIQYTHRQNELINGTIYEFNMKCPASENTLSFNAFTNKLIYIINHKKTSFQLNTKDDIRQISQQGQYDIRNPRLWTLKNFYSYLQAKQDSTQIKTLSLQLAIQDSTGQITDSYPAHLAILPLFPEYREPLGFISGDTLYATYDFPLLVFIRSAIGQIILTIIISALLIVCTINLWQTIRNEKKRGEYRELFIHNLVHDLKRPVANQIKTCYLLREVPPRRISPFARTKPATTQRDVAIDQPDAAPIYGCPRITTKYPGNRSPRNAGSIGTTRSLEQANRQTSRYSSRLPAGKPGHYRRRSFFVRRLPEFYRQCLQILRQAGEDTNHLYRTGYPASASQDKRQRIRYFFQKSETCIRTLPPGRSARQPENQRPRSGIVLRPDRHSRTRRRNRYRKRRRQRDDRHSHFSPGSPYQKEI